MTKAPPPRIMDVSKQPVKEMRRLPCYVPMLARRVGITESGKPKYSIASRYEGVKLDVTDTVVPCGQCIGCRLDYSRTWANRMMCELMYHETAYFVTLTYNAGHIPISYYPDPDTGEAYESLTLLPPDLQGWIKRLRRQQELAGNTKHLMYYACGEYGGVNKRPHYHVIIYDMVLPDLEPCGKSRAGEYTYYKSEILERTWCAPAVRDYIQVDRGCKEHLVRAGVKSPIGNVQVCCVSWETCAYVARYILKKQKGDGAVYYDTFGLVPEFTRMSLKPAIGKQYFDEHGGEIYDIDQMHIKTASRGISCRPPAYFDRLFDCQHPDRLREIKRKRVVKAERALAAELAQYSGSYFDLLASKERALHDRSRKLIRPIES